MLAPFPDFVTCRVLHDAKSETCRGNPARFRLRYAIISRPIRSKAIYLLSRLRLKVRHQV